MRVLIQTMHRPDRAPNQRFRFEQYLDVLAQEGIACDVSYLIDAEADSVLYAPGGVARKAGIAWRSWRRRRRESSPRSLKQYDAVLVVREALFFGGPMIERRIKRAGVPLIFDFDDAIWLSAKASRANRMFSWLKRPDKIPAILSMADLVIAGNRYLADFAESCGARRIEIVPTTIDTGEYVPRADAEANGERPVCIGWSGSFSTIAHLRTCLPALYRVKERLGERVTFRVIGDATFHDEHLGITGLPWRKETELDDLRAIDIGIMPLPDDDWSRGKCGLKGLQYMALEIPTLMSPVGVNAEIIEDGVNGYLPATDDEWVDRLVTLVNDAPLREKLGKAGRATVEQRYSKRSQQDRMLELLRSATRTDSKGT